MASAFDYHGTPPINQESLPFLNDARDSTSLSQRRFIRKGFGSSLLAKPIAIHGAFILTYTMIFIFVALWNTSYKTLHELNLYSPVESNLEYEARPVDGLAEGSIYAGYPRPESEAAWRELMEGSNVKIYPEEMSELGETSLNMSDGSGSLAVIGVYHEIHCVKRLRKWLYRDFYYPNQTDLEFNERFTHAEHCLEFIRQAAMCHGDITVTSFKWLHDSHGKVIEPTTKEGALHRCVKWDSISSWTHSRRVNLFDPNLLVPESTASG